MTTSTVQPEDSTLLNDGIVDVWVENFEVEMERVRQVVKQYKYIAMDTEFPGVVVRAAGSFDSARSFHYATLRHNCNLLRIIQIGLTFSNEKGEFPEGTRTWQFNFRFSLTKDIFNADSINLLEDSGLNFAAHETKGIDVETFGEALITSGLILMDDVHWITFHSGYDFGYLLRIVTGSELPEREKEFFEVLGIFFPNIYDVKEICKYLDMLRGGLNKVAEVLQITRIGPSHQAGSDSLLTSSVFFRTRELVSGKDVAENVYKNLLFGLGDSLRSSSASAAEAPPASEHEALFAD